MRYDNFQDLNIISNIVTHDNIDNDNEITYLDTVINDSNQNILCAPKTSLVQMVPLS